jgi:protein O-GlcNAc transferase
MPSPLQQADAMLQAGRAADALALLRAHLRAQPADMQALTRAANVLARQGQLADVEPLVRAGLAAEPRSPGLWSMLSSLLRHLGRLGESLAAAQTAVTLDPAHPSRLADLSDLQYWSGDLASCARTCAALLEVQPTHSDAAIRHGACLQLLGRPGPAIESLRKSLTHQPANYALAEGIATAMNASPDADAASILAAHERFALMLERAVAERGFAPRFAADAAAAAAPVPGDRPIRLAMLSGDLRRHSVAFFLLGWLGHIDRRRVRITLYSTSATQDDITERLRSLVGADAFITLAGVHAPDQARALASSGSDLLIELAGLTGANNLPVIAMHPVARQATYLGYSNTTGLRRVGWRLVDALTDEPGIADTHAVESLVRIEPPFVCYCPPGDAPPVSPLPSLDPRAPVTLGCLNAMSKWNDATMRLWAGALRACDDALRTAASERPPARLLLKCPGIENAPVADDIRRRLAEVGIDPARVDLVGKTLSQHDHLATLARVDIALDTFPYHGTTTTCEALHMGVPVVSLVGDRHASRVGLSLLTAIARPQWCTRTPDDYARAVAALAADTPRLAAERATLRDRLARSPLCDGPGFARRFTRAIESICRPGLTPAP